MAFSNFMNFNKVQKNRWRKVRANSPFDTTYLRKSSTTFFCYLPAQHFCVLFFVLIFRFVTLLMRKASCTGYLFAADVVLFAALLDLQFWILVCDVYWWRCSHRYLFVAAGVVNGTSSRANPNVNVKPTSLNGHGACAFRSLGMKNNPWCLFVARVSVILNVHVSCSVVLACICGKYCRMQNIENRKVDVEMRLYELFANF